jgi:hypothetical protein
MIVAPIVFCVVVHGIAGAGDLKKVGRVGVKALIYFETMTTVALIIGLLLAYLFGPGHGMNIDPSTLDAKALNTYADNAHKLKGGGIGAFLINIIPTTSFDALARNDVLQVLFFAIIFGVSLAGRRRKGREDHLADRRGIDRAVPRDGADRARRAARRARRGGLYGRTISDRQLRCDRRRGGLGGPSRPQQGTAHSRRRGIGGRDRRIGRET